MHDTRITEQRCPALFRHGGDDLATERSGVFCGVTGQPVQALVMKLTMLGTQTGNSQQWNTIRQNDDSEFEIEADSRMEAARMSSRLFDEIARQKNGTCRLGLV
ncbi:MAG TPA: hypothetical protein VES70_14725 [Pseudomonas sp.]|nr:hypothetical protein [Pseudomonas sp.]